MMQLKSLLMTGLVIQLMIATVVLLLNSSSFPTRNVREYAAGENDCPTINEVCATEAPSRSPTSHKTKLYTDILVAIFSRPSAVEMRKASRETWMSELQDKSKALYRFVMGTGNLTEEEKKALRQESNTYKDIILLENHEESFGPACTKKLLLTMQWAVDNVECTYFMKADDDCYLRIEALLHTLNSKRSTVPILHGSLRFNALPIREGRYADDQWNLGYVYPPFPYGSGYTISFGLVKNIVRSNSIVPLRQFPNEDVTIGLWLAPYYLRYLECKRFYYDQLESKGENIPLCPPVIDNIYVFHYDQSPALMRKAHVCLRGVKSSRS